jgi:hypothetical protein
MIEIETLGPVVTVGCGEFVEHQETWYLLKDQVVPEEDAACGAWLADIAAAHPI